MISNAENTRKNISQNYSHRKILLKIRNVEPCLFSKNLQHPKLHDKALEIYHLRNFKENFSLRQILPNVY